MTRLSKTLAIIAFMASSIASGPSWADTSSSDTAIASLEQRLDSLEAQEAKHQSQEAQLKQELQQQKQEITELKEELHQQKQVASQNALQAANAQTANSTVNPTANSASPSAIVTANTKDGFSIQSPEGNFTLRVGGYTQVEARDFADNNKEELGEVNSILDRRARLILQGTVAHDFDYYVEPDFGYNNNYGVGSQYNSGSPYLTASRGSINVVGAATTPTPTAYSVSLQEGWIDYRYSPDFIIKAGKMKTPFDLENLQDTRNTDFIELGLTSNLSPQRDVGVQVGGNLYYDWITYEAGLFDGAADLENGNGGYPAAGDTNSRNGVGRIFATPFKDTSIKSLQGLGIGYAVSYGKEKGSDLPTYISPGQAPVFAYYNSASVCNSISAAACSTNGVISAAGPQLRTEPQAYYYYKSLGILGEKVNDYESLQEQSSRSATIQRDKVYNRAFSVEMGYVLTGEDASYNGVTPRYDFAPSKGNWGAFELVTRYGELKLDKSIFYDSFSSLNTSIESEKSWGLGLNWYLNRNAKVSFAFEQTKFKGGAYPDGTDSQNSDANETYTGNRKTENLFETMLQLSI